MAANHRIGRIYADVYARAPGDDPSVEFHGSGPPCQAYSLAGCRQAPGDTTQRGEHIFEMAHRLVAMQPEAPP